ncbi:hypothetical protein D3C80_1432110 [compost metagenome]
MQRGAAECPARRHAHQAAAEDRTGHGHVAKPVGGQAQSQDSGDIAFAHAQPRIQAIAHGDAPDPSAEVEVEGVADDAHGQDLPPAQALSDVGAADQVEAGVGQEAQHSEHRGDDQCAHFESGQGVEHFVPVDALGEQCEQHNQQ